MSVEITDGKSNESEIAVPRKSPPEAMLTKNEMGRTIFLKK